MPESSSIDYGLLLPQALVAVVDSMSYMVVSPSIVFYVLGLGGTKEQYGIILSAFSFASFAAKPFLGYWSDKSGGKFRAPYLVSIAIASLGGLLYFVGSAFEGRVAVAVVLAGRLLGGVGAANQALGFSYIAQVIPKEHLTRGSAVLSMCRVMGMAVAPALNVFMTKAHGNLFGVEVTPLNTVGLFLFVANLISFVVIFTLLKDPPTSTRPPAAVDEVDERSSKFWKEICCLDIGIPILSVFTLNACFQLLETGLAPAASDALGYGPVAISAIFGANALMIFAAILATFSLSARGVSDEALLTTGLGFSIVGYSSIYFLWKVDTAQWLFILPIVISTFAFPFMGSPTRSIFTRIVDSKDSLRYHQGTLQAIMSMAASVAGFTTPGLIASYILRTSDEVAESKDHRELTSYALFGPLLSVVTLCGVIYLRITKQQMLDGDEGIEAAGATEATSLVAPPSRRPSRRATEPNFRFHPKTEADRRNSTMVMGIPQFSYHPQTIPELAQLGLTEEDF